MFTVKPMIGQIMASQDVTEGNDATLTCIVILGHPSPKIVWTKMGEQIQSSARIVDDGKGNLLLKNVKIKDEGEYACVATNIGGSVSRVITLDVQGN